MKNIDRFLVSAIVSTYAAERFMRGCLEDLAAQTLFTRGQLQIIVIDSHSPQDEAAIVQRFAAGDDRVVYHRTQHRETLYAAWNRAIDLAEGRYLTTANTDDRHRRDALERLVDALEAGGAGLAYADSLVTAHENETFVRHSARRILRWPEFSARQLLTCSIFGPQPVWRRSLHADVGYFDPAFEVAGDYDFFVRLGLRHGAIHVPEVLGLYFDGGMERRRAATCLAETDRLLRAHRRAVALERVYPALVHDRSDLSRAAALVDFGNLALENPPIDAEWAHACYVGAAEILPGHPVILGNIAAAARACGASGGDPARPRQRRTARRGWRSRWTRSSECFREVQSIEHPVCRGLPPLEPPGSALRKLGPLGRWFLPKAA